MTTWELPILSPGGRRSPPFPSVAYCDCDESATRVTNVSSDRSRSGGQTWTLDHGSWTLDPRPRSSWSSPGRGGSGRGGMSRGEVLSGRESFRTSALQAPAASPVSSSH